MERSWACSLEFKDLDTKRRTAVIKHAVYNSIDRVGDISQKGMFNKSWQEHKQIDFLFNHIEGAIPGNVKSVYEDDEGAYTTVSFGNWTLGDDVLAMADAGVLKGASFGYVAKKSDPVIIKGRKVRKLKEVVHVETSLLTKLPAHPEAGIVSLNKSFNPDELRNDIAIMERFCRNSRASDYAIKSVMQDIEDSRRLLGEFEVQGSEFYQGLKALKDKVERESESENDILKKLLLLKMKM